MKIVEQIGMNINKYINNKHILEIGCGCAEFSIMASMKALTVECIDLDDSRLLPEAREKENLSFHKMDATSLMYNDELFDTVVIYNALGHLASSIERVIYEGMRVLKTGGSFLIITNWKLDKSEIKENLLPFLVSNGVKFDLQEKGKTTYVILTK